MRTKLVKDLQIGDVVKLSEPDGAGRISRFERSRLFRASGGCFRLDVDVTAGPNKGKKVTDQHHPGDEAVELAEK